MAKVTIKDVAREAGVSIGTVSNALNDLDVVSNDTKLKIVEVAKRLNYVPNINGKLLKAGKSKMLGFFTVSMSGPYFYLLIDAMTRACEKKGYGLDIIVTRDKKMIMENILGKRLDGVIVFEGGRRVGATEVDMLSKEDIKTVYLDREIVSPNATSILFNSYKAGVDITNYLINLGHRKIYFVTGPSDVYDNEQRQRGFKQALISNGLPFKEEYVLQGLFEQQFTYNSIRTFVRNHPAELPDAFICGNDLSAIGCIQALKEEGYRVPEDISVAGFDDIEIAQYFHPSLTTLKNPIAMQGMLAIEHLVRMIDGGQGVYEQLDGALIVRDSCTINHSNRM